MIKTVFSNRYYLFFARVIIALVFICAGSIKISDPNTFSQAIANYKLTPIWAINFIAIALPWIEVISGVLLLFGISVKEVSIIILLSLIVFNTAIIINLFRGLNIDCGCFGGGMKIGLLKLSENFLMIFLSYTLIIFGSDFIVLRKSKLI